MHSRRLYKNKKFIQLFLLSFTIVLFIPLTAGLFSHLRMLALLKTISLELSQNFLRHVVDSYDTLLKDTEKKLILLTNNTIVRNAKYFNTERISENILNLWKLYGEEKNSMNRYLGIDTINFLVHYDFNDLVLCLDSHYVMNEDYGRLIQIGDLNLEKFTAAYLQWNRQPLFFPETTVFLEGRPFTAVPYVNSIPQGNEHFSDGTVIYFLSTKPLKQAFSETAFPNSILVVMEDENIILTSTSKKTTTSAQHSLSTGSSFFKGNTPQNREVQQLYHELGELQTGMVSVMGDYLATKSHSSFNNWDYIMLSPASTLFQRFNKMAIFVWSLFSLSLLIGIISVLSFSFAYAKPLDSAYRALHNEATGRTESKRILADFTSRIGSLVNSKNELQDKYETGREQLRNVFFNHIINGTFHDETSVQEFLYHAELHFDGEMYVMMLMVVDDSSIPFKQRNRTLDTIIHTLAYETAESQTDESIGLHVLERNHAVLIIPYNELDVASCLPAAEKTAFLIKGELKKRLGLTCHFYGGGVCSSIIDLHQICNQAFLTARLTKPEPLKTITWYSELPRQESRYYYPQMTSKALEAHSRNGNFTAIEEVIDKVYAENFKRRMLSPESVLLLLRELELTLWKICNELGLENNNRALLSEHSPENLAVFFAKLKSSFRRICEQYRDHTKSIPRYVKPTDIDIITTAEKIINRRYTDKTFSLSELGDELCVSYAYLSRLYRNHTGRNLVDYMESIRIQHAIRLLEEGSTAILSIANEVGYASGKSFRRAFKRVTGMSPRYFRSKR